MATGDKLAKVVCAEIVAGCRAACQVDESLGHAASAQLVVASVNLCVCFLEQWHPKLLAEALGEDRSSLGVTWDEFVDGHRLPAPVFAKFDTIDAFFVVFWRLEKSLDQSRLSCEDRNG